MKKIIAFFIIMFVFFINQGCIQRGLHNPEKELTFTFEESDFEDDYDVIEKAQVVGDFNDWDSSPEAWHFYGFNDKGIPPDETKGDKIWTAKFVVPYGEYGYKFKINGSSETDPNNEDDLVVSDDS